MELAPETSAPNAYPECRIDHRRTRAERDGRREPDPKKRVHEKEHDRACLQPQKSLPVDPVITIRAEVSMADPDTYKFTASTRSRYLASCIRS